MKSLLVLIRKDLLLEARGKETLIVMASLSILLCVIITSGVGSAFLKPSDIQKLYSPLLWIVFVVTATISLERSIDSELEDRAFEGVILTGVSLSLVYLSKVAAHSLTVFVVHLFSAVLLAVLLNVGITPIFPTLATLSLFVVLGYCALAVLMVAMTATARLRSSILPLVLIPLLFPLFFAATELTAGLVAQGALDLGSFWLSLLLALDVVYIVFGINLYRFALAE
jgi:heme exporter protein B